MKKIISALLFVLCVLTMGRIDSFAISISELEESATRLEFNQPVTGIFETSEDEDWYRFEITEAGYMEFNFGLTDNSVVDNVHQGWDISIYSKEDITSTVKCYDSVLGNMKTPKISLPKGIYYIEVDADHDYNETTAPVACEYQLSVDYTTNELWETEANNLSADATVINANTTYTGALYCSEDEDWYKVTTDKAGKLTLDFKLSDDADVEEIDHGWMVYIMDSQMNILKKYTDIKGDATFDILPFEAGTYYVRVDADYDYNDSTAPTDCGYTICMNHVYDASWESEYNDEKAKSDTITANKVYSGTLYKSDDVDWYKVTTTKAGKMQVVFNLDESVNLDDVHYGWKIKIYDASLNILKEYTDIKSNMKSAILPFTKGTYYVEVSADYDYNDTTAPTDCIYKLKFAHTVAATWESEVNDTKAKSDTITVNKTYYGNLYRSDDVDWYKVTTTKTGYFQVKFGVSTNISLDDIDYGWKFTVYDKNLKVIKEYTEVKKTKTSAILPYAKGTYYIKVEADYDYNDTTAPTDCTYTLNVINKASSAWESEGNDTKSKADTIKANTDYNGLFNRCDDVDWYKFTVNSSGTASIKLSKHSSAKSDDIDGGWKMEIYKGSTLVKKVEEITKSKAYKFDLKKGTYYVKISSDYDYNDSTAPTDCRYILKATYTAAPKASKVTGLTCKSKKVTVKWSKSTDATGYYIYRSTSKNGTYKKVATITKNSTVKYTEKKALTKNKTYYYKVVAYKKANNVVATAAAGNVKSIKVK